ncbi:hypothetical protein [Aliikangiella coralliicola]|uniref:Uncharacterized protein n=1 Tax=Aliikangiella coralliicola TaxID=2592383 RepID=A0A545UFL9_9GAMM|nr:hypothetical protein [Aliikangiella coralliicola]TQV88268.1 hypothetical protein FLL46_07000 [Aliikangiella coralliicola]
MPLLIGSIEAESMLTYFRAYLMDDGAGANMWLMLHTGPWEPYEIDCAVLIHSVAGENGVTAYLKDQCDSPWKETNTQELHFLSRDEVLRQEGGKNWAFETYDYFIGNQNEVYDFFHKGM